MKVDEDIVRWTGSFMRNRRVRMVIDRREEEDLEVTTGLPQGSLVSPILFVIYVSGVHRAGEGGGLVRSLSFVEDITWVAQGGPVREIIAKLEGAARRAVDWGESNGVAFEPAKTGHSLFEESEALEGPGKGDDQGRVPPGKHRSRQRPPRSRHS